MTDTVGRYVALAPGEPAPTFIGKTDTSPRYTFDSAAGRWLVLMLAASTSLPVVRDALAKLARVRPLFDDHHAAFFGVVAQAEPQAKTQLPGVRWFIDDDLAISKAYGAASIDAKPGPSIRYRPMLYLLDPQMRLFAIRPADQIDAFIDEFKALPEPDLHGGAPSQAPVLIAPRVFEPELCRRLIDAYEGGDHAESGFMREIGGKTTHILDPDFKRRRDHNLIDQALIQEARRRVTRRLVPQIRKVFQFNVTRMERDIVACYRAQDAGFFKPHRDNTTAGTAHRRFAVTINLNAEDYEGGELVFPEFGAARFKPPTGGAVVFSCSLLHTVLPVTRGDRYAFLPFLYDEEAAKVRHANNPHLSEEVAPYQLG